jgi:hypothetical protein
MHKIDALQLHSRNLLAAISLFSFVYICAESAADERVSVCLDRENRKLSRVRMRAHNVVIQ